MIDYPAATVALFDPTTGELPRRKLDAKRLRDFLRRLTEAGASSFLVGSSTGHGHLRTVPELESMFRVAAEAEVSDGTLMGLLRPEDGLQTNRRLLCVLKGLSYSVAYLRPSVGLDGADDDAIVANLAPITRVACEIGIPVGLYSISDVSGAAMSAEAAARIVRSPGGENVVAIKVTESNYETGTLRFLRHNDLKHLKIVQGWDPHLARALKDGSDDAAGGSRCGITSGAMSFAIYQYQHILAACAAGDWAEVESAQEAVSILFAAMQDDPAKFANLQTAKYIMGLGHPITSTISDEQCGRVIDALRTLTRELDRNRLAASLNLMGDGPFQLELDSIRTDA